MCGSAMYVKRWQWMRRVQQMQAATDALPGATNAVIHPVMLYGQETTTPTLIYNTSCWKLQ